MAKWNPLALKLLMWLMGVLIVAGSAFPTWIPFDTWFGITASVAGVAFGAGIMIAGFDPIGNVSWVRAVILYAILQVIYQSFLQISIGRFDFEAFLVAVIVGGMLLWLYPNKAELWMQGKGADMGSGVARSKS
ncbi:MAG: hypothetical protein E6I95_15510 [Chloroflexi bacterium]|nr:MAG: hypothetical protein E6I95_15510 [Chloroflexota bacterium]